MTPDRARRRLATLRAGLDGRAAGLWRRAGDRLELVAFDPAPDLPGHVARGFEAATRSVALVPDGLGIVRAALAGEVAVSLAAELPPDAGSGLWLRAFGAARSVAVPTLGEGGRVEVVASVALGPGPPDEVVADRIRAAIGGLAAESPVKFGTGHPG